MSTHTTTAVEVLPPVTARPSVALTTGNDAATAKIFRTLYSDAQTGVRRIIALGLFAWEIKETKLKHGEFGPWLAAHCPELSLTDSVTGRAKPTPSLNQYMALTRSVLEGCGFETLQIYFTEIGRLALTANLQNGGYLLAAPNKVPTAALALREKIFNLVDGKTQRQLFLRFKQSEEDAEGNLSPKRGRLKGKGGVTALQRSRYQGLVEEARIRGYLDIAREITIWLREMSDAKGFGAIQDTPEMADLHQAINHAKSYLTLLAKGEAPQASAAN